MQWPSSPIRERESLEAVEEQQRARAAALYRPMSSPVSKTAAARSSAADARNRAQMYHAREQLRLLRLVAGRERIDERENYARQLAELERQAAALDADPNELEEAGWEEVSNDYESELDDYLLQQELELEQQLREMQLT